MCSPEKYPTAWTGFLLEPTSHAPAPVLRPHPSRNSTSFVHFFQFSGLTETPGNSSTFWGMYGYILELHKNEDMI